MFEYALYFLITLSVSTLFGVAGLGSSLVLIPLFTFLGLDFNLAKAMGLFINGITTLSLTLKNIKSKILMLREIIPLLFIGALFAMFGAFGSDYISHGIVKMIFVLFIFFSLGLLLLGDISPYKSSGNETKRSIYPFIALIAFIGGLIGVGGGAVYLPLFLYIGIKTKQSIAMTSALIPVVSFSAFFSYSSFVEIDWILLGDVALAALFGAFFAHKIMLNIENERNLKIITSLLLFTIAMYMVYVEFLGELV